MIARALEVEMMPCIESQTYEGDLLKFSSEGVGESLGVDDARTETCARDISSCFPALSL
jgi:hypothetical protein